MAYAAATSLNYTIWRIVNHLKISLVPPSRKIIKFAHAQATSLQLLLPKLDETRKSSSRKRVNVLDEQIREAVSQLEDVLESHVTDQLLSQSDQERNGDGIQFSIDLVDLKQDIHSFTKRVRKLKRAYRKELKNMLPEDDDNDDASVSSATDFGVNKSKLVGLSDQFDKVKDWVADACHQKLSLVLLRGMPGIGKSTLAKEIFEDPDVLGHFRCRAWVTVGRKHGLKDIVRAIIAQVKPNSLILGEEDVEGMAYYLKESLKGRRFLIVVDDVWEKGVWDEVSESLPDDNNGSRVLLTTRLKEVATSPFTLKMRFLNEEESWDLLREKVFTGELCPHQLEKAGKKIAEVCDGLPLTIVAIAKLLSKVEMTPEYWNEVAENRNSVFKVSYDEISKVLYPSYDYLPQHLKMCFIYTGVFPLKYVITRSKLINMWIAEEFLETPEEYYASECLTKLVDNSLVMVCQKSSSRDPRIKTFRVHSSLWHLCKAEARKNKSFHALTSLKDGLSEDKISQRRLCIHNNMLFGIKDVCSSLEDDCASSARFLGCFGPYHPYQVPVTFGFRLLRLLDTLAIRFYDFPTEVLKLVQLRYLALTYNGNLPPSISKLWNLEFLIVSPHSRTIKSHGAPSHLPMEIWDMKELRHLQITGSDFLDPSCDTSLPQLLTLLDVSDRICTKGVLERISTNLMKLGLRIELRPDGDEPLSCFPHLSCLHKIRTLRCIVVNPHGSGILASPTPPDFPLGIRKLTLSGMGYPWEEMSKIASLPFLRVLKLQNYAFRGPKWEMKENEFTSLSILIIEDTDLVQWKVGYQNCSMYILSRISLKHCYKLKEIYWEFPALPDKIQIVNCNPLTLTCFEQIKPIIHNAQTTIDAHFSWGDGDMI